jgi:general secretion pathway protein D
VSKEESGSFLKKRTKNLLRVWAEPLRKGRSQNRPTFFASFFQKRRSFFLLALLAGCQSDAEPVPRLSIDDGTTARPFTARAPAETGALNLQTVPSGRAYVVHGQRPGTSAAQAAPGQAATGGSYVLNFDNAEIRDVAKAVLGDMLQVSYAVAPAVQGNISLHTATPLPREAVLPALEDALTLAGAALVPNGDGYNIVPLQNAARTSGRRGQGGAGYRVEIVPLRYISAAEAQHLIEPLVAQGTIIQVDPQRNLLIAGGSASELARVTQTIALFDVDWLRSQSFGLFPLAYSQARSVAADLQSMIAQGPMAGLVRIIPIEHLNAVLVVSSRPAYVDEMRGWVERFDRGRDTASPRVFVYHVQHGRAADIAAVLTKALGPRNGGGAAAPEAGGLQDAGGGADQHLAAPAPQPGANPLLGGLTTQGANDLPLGDVRITADDTNNALLIVTTGDKYRLVEQALQQLDAVPLQVMLEACVAEVHLTNQLQYGLQYYFHSGNFSALQSTVVPSSLAADTGGLSLLFSQGNNIQVVLDLLNSLSKVKVISAPQVMVVNNRTASIEVGDQVPIATSTAVGVITANAPVVNTIQLLDTGIILKVTPRVGSGGLVLLDINQEVSSVVPTTSSTINSPTIQQRKINSSIAVQDGQTLMIGGLISDTRTKTRTGIPYLMDLPYVGPLFSLRNDQLDRTELIVLITPRVVHNEHEAEEVTDELRLKLPMIRELSSPARR